MKITIEEKDKNKALMLLRNDEALALLWELDQKLREYQKYDLEKSRDDVLDELRAMIWENNILDLWN